MSGYRSCTRVLYINCCAWYVNKSYSFNILISLNRGSVWVNSIHLTAEKNLKKIIRIIDCSPTFKNIYVLLEYHLSVTILVLKQSDFIGFSTVDFSFLFLKFLHKFYIPFSLFSLLGMSYSTSPAATFFWNVNPYLHDLNVLEQRSAYIVRT